MTDMQDAPVRSALPPGTAPIKPQYLISRSIAQPQAGPDDDAAEGSASHVSRGDIGDSRGRNGGNRGAWKSKSKAEKKAQRGMNTGRRFNKVRDELELCWKVANGVLCELGSDAVAPRCRFSHDIDAYLAAKPQDLRIPSTAEFTDTPPFGPGLSIALKPHPRYPNVDIATQCPIFAETGECRYGYKCRFLGGHISEGSEGNITLSADEDRKAQAALTAHEMNFVSADVQKDLRSRKYPLPISNKYLREIQTNDGNSKPVVIDASRLGDPDYDVAQAVEEAANSMVEDTEMSLEGTVSKRTGETNGAAAAAAQDTPDVPMRFSEKKRLNWKGKSYLAPLTTVGNLVCVHFPKAIHPSFLGADLTATT
ncbi:hypothetical protein MD484_g703, partial [Candolleomyces efflorescens]